MISAIGSYLIYLTYIFLISSFYRFQLERRRRNQLLAQFPSPKKYPLVGNISLRSNGGLFKRFKYLLPRYQSPMVFWLFEFPFIFVYDPDTYKIVATKSFSRGIFSNFGNEFTPDTIILTKEPKLWKDHRRFLTPAFNVSTMGKFYLEMHKSINASIVTELHSLADTGDTINLWNYIPKWELRKILKSTVRKENVSDAECMNYMNLTKQFTRYLTNRACNPWLYPKIISRIMCHFNGILKITKEIREYSIKALKDYEEWKSEQTKSSSANDDVKILADYLLSPEGKELYTETNAADELMTFLLAGYETSVSCICFTLLSLAVHKEYQEKVYQEIMENIGQDLITDPEQLDKLTFLEQCINESLRLFPPVPGVTRSADEDIILKDGRVIPKGSTTGLMTMTMHRDSKLYPNPTVFDPHRFHPDEVKKRCPNSFVPFSLGPRQCLGYKFAYMNIKNVLMTIIREFELSSNMNLAKLNLTFFETLNNKSGFHVQIQRRER